MWRLVILGCLTAACRPPEAPEGLDGAASHVFREFYEDHTTVELGLQGFMDWYDSAGYELVDQEADAEKLDAFSLASLTANDIAGLPLVGEERDVAAARGVVALARMNCSWQEAEALLVRSDQHKIFPSAFQDYEREFLSSREAFETARDDGSFGIVDAPLRGEDGELTAGAYEDAFLSVHNHVVGKELGIEMPFELAYFVRHGVYELSGEQVPVMTLQTYIPERAVGTGGKNSIEQNYSVELIVGLDDSTSLRMYANWVEIGSNILGSDSPLVAISAVNKAQATARELSDVCEGKTVLEAEF